MGNKSSGKVGRLNNSLSCSISTESERLTRTVHSAHNHIPLLDLMQETSEHRLFVEAAIVAEAVLVQIGLQVVTANRVVNALDSVLNQRPESFDGLRVNVASNVDFLAVPDAPMVVVIRSTSEPIISRKVIVKTRFDGITCSLIRPCKVSFFTSAVTKARTLPLR